MKQQRVDAPPPVASEEARMRCQSKSNMQAALASAFWGNMELKCTNDQRRKVTEEANDARERARAIVYGNLGVETGSTFEGDIEQMTLEDLQCKIDARLERVQDQQRIWSVRSASGNRAICLLNDIAEFVGEFSGVVEVMKAADQAYGGVAYSALSVFLSVAVNTKGKDDLIDGVIVSLKAEYSRTVLLSEIYHTPEMNIHCNSEKKRLEILRTDLSHHMLAPDKTVETYFNLLSESFDRPPGLPRFSVDNLRSEEAYVRWRGSPADSTDISARLRKEAGDDASTRNAVVELYCQKTSFMSDSDQPKPISLIFNMLLQLLGSDLSILRDQAKYQKLRKRLGELKGTGHEELDKALGILIEVLKNFDVVNVVLDRVDRVQGSCFMRLMLTGLMSSPRTSGAKILVFCVACCNSQSMSQRIAELRDEMDDKALITLRKDQSLP
ncbi:hypothetical protein CKAH01_18035 [Colletotrichum kahawae]|uniref:DUF7708 domain-containing protein n=1 Tax=Colletotrichum kahawae TaxID=34407 RepID=A0AAE0D2N6_COLKA|nr:hypothetical protein CKAH01_18035 [Colletotrichum kahawae]